MKLDFIRLIAVCFLISSFSVHSQIVMLDTFESADFLSTNSDGFMWESTNRTSIVNKDGVVNNGRVVNNPIANGLNWDPRTPESADDVVGEHMMRYRYQPGASWTEQRYDMGGAYPEVWISYWIRVPRNYARPSGTNNKWFNIWMGRSKNLYSADYENNNISRIEMQDWPGSSNSMDINIQFRNGSDGKYRNSNRYANFVTPADAGRWMKILYHFKASSSNSADDGILRMYRRWHSEADYELINDLTNLNVGVGSGSVAAGRLGWGAGYVMGYANAAYSEATDWLLDDFTVANHSLLGVNTPPLSSPPRPPESLGASVD